MGRMLKTILVVLVVILSLTGLCFAQTETADEIVGKMAEAYDALNSYEVTVTMDAGFVVDGEEINQKLTYAGKKAYDPYGLAITTQAGGDGADVRYIIYKDSTAYQFYVYSDGSWNHGEFTEMTAELMNSIATNEDNIEMYRYINSIGSTLQLPDETINERPVYVISCINPSLNYAEAINAMTAIRMGTEPQALSADETAFYEAMHPVKTIFYIDKETYLPLKIAVDNLDYTKDVDLVNSMLNAQEETVTRTKMTLTAVYSGFDTITSITPFLMITTGK